MHIFVANVFSTEPRPNTFSLFLSTSAFVVQYSSHVPSRLSGMNITMVSYSSVGFLQSVLTIAASLSFRVEFSSSGYMTYGRPIFLVCRVTHHVREDHQFSRRRSLLLYLLPEEASDVLFPIFAMQLCPSYLLFDFFGLNLHACLPFPYAPLPCPDHFRASSFPCLLRPISLCSSLFSAGHGLLLSLNP